MPPVKHTEAEESEFLQSLFGDFNSTTAVPPPTSPTRRRVAPPQPRTPLRASRFNGSPRGATARATRSSESPKARHTVYAAQDVDFDALMEGVEDWDWDEMNSDFLTPRKSSPVKPKRSKYNISAEKCQRSPATRCTIKEVEERFVSGRFEKVLSVYAASTQGARQIVLRDDWSHADVRAGDTVNVVGEWTVPSASSSVATPVPVITVCSKHNLFIHHPDVLLTATSLSNASQCPRKPLLSNMIRSSSDVTPSLVWGHMLHEVMQTCLSVARWDDKFMDKKIAEVVQGSLEELLRIDIGIEQAIIEVKARAKGLKAFAEKYMAPSPKPEAFLTNTRAGKGESSLLAISQLYDVEEDIWSPTYGLKGKIDASVEAVVHDLNDSGTPFVRAAPQVRKHSSPMPFEIKTGRAVAGMEHRAQTMLYTLLMGERYGTEIPSGLLYYTQSEEVVRVPAARNEIRALLVMRNEMAGYMMRRLRAAACFSDLKDEEDGELDVTTGVEPFLPPTIDDNRICGKCYVLDSCMLYRKAVEEVDDHDSEIADIYALKTGHLSSSQAALFKKWEALISLEEKDLVRFRKELWTMSANAREEKGRCFADMVLDLTYRHQESIKTSSRREGKIHQFTYRFTKCAAGGASLLSGHIALMDAVTVSVEPELLALARGFIVDLAPDAVVLGVDHEIDDGLIADRLHSLRGSPPDPVVYRIDKDELSGGMARIRDNLAQLFYAGGDSRRLRLIVDLAKPLFADGAAPQLTDASSHLNDNQRQAVDKVLRAQDYALVLGMPGTGKTTVIAAIIQELVRAGKTVLLTSYTHSAVDTILSKLDDATFGILRLGNLDKIHPAVQKHTLAARNPAKTIEQLEQQVMSPPVVATTCLSIDQNKAARKGGLEVSLFRRLSDAHPEAVVDLTHQYRMNSDIMLLSNKLIYSDRLRCGSEAVASRSLSLPNEKFLDFIHAKSTCRTSPCWMKTLMSESCKAVFVDTDQVPAQDSRVGDLVENKIEAQLVYQVTECLLGCGVQQDQIGILSLYRQQIKLLSYLLQDRKKLEILTADRSQGRDKDCIIISMVRSNDNGQIGELVKDWRRMNVSFTRARSKLIIIGSRKTLQGTPLLQEFFQLMDSQGWILTLPPDAHLLHDFPVAALGKRSVRELEEDVEDLIPGSVKAKENGKELGSVKRARNVAAREEGILKGRPLLRDVVNAHK
ncbi:Dna2-domain-containing protein [Trametes polyzona]|nr:Dna2-domain-containing protein [Trametes polyzona]